MTSDIPALPAATRAAYLERLGLAAPGVDLAGLTALQAAHLRALPFHNLQLLAADGADPGPPAIEAAIEAAVRGLGGTCHLLTPPFVALLRALGFDAWLASASVGEDGDHLVGVVRVGDALHLCDVGNGHPYLRPFVLGEEPDSASAYGWTFTLEPWSVGAATHRLRRRLPNGTWKTVYTLDPRPVEYASFAGIIRGHHMRAGFGPFLTGLRAARIGVSTLWTLRDRMLERFHASGRIHGRREIADDAAIGRVLAHCFGLAGLPWATALEVWRRRAGAVVASLEEPPLRVLFAVGVTDRPGGLRRLGSGLLRARSRARWGEDAVGVLAVDNGCAPGSLAEEAAALRAEGLPARVVPGEVAARWQARLFDQGLVPDAPATPRRSIATLRNLQVAAIWEHLGGATWSTGLPRADGPLAVWMVDDDLEVMRLEHGEHGLVSRPADDLLLRAARLRRAHPEAAVLIGGTTGCPPVPGFQFVAAQLVDLAAHVAAAANADPAAPYRPEGGDRTRPDYYYDHSDAGPAYAATFPWEPVDTVAPTIREALLGHLRAIEGMTWGMPCTRLLVDCPATAVAPTTARGGNALFLDVDALFAAPTLALRCADGVVTRRGDTVWGEIMASGAAGAVMQAPLPLLHVRRCGDHSAPTSDEAPDTMRRFVAAQQRGIALTRLVAGQRSGAALPAAAVLATRAARTRGALAAADAALRAIEGWRDRAAWWSADEPVRGAIGRAGEVAAGVLAAFARLEAEEPPEIAAELERFAANVPAAVARWQELWR